MGVGRASRMVCHLPLVAADGSSVDGRRRLTGVDDHGHTYDNSVSMREVDRSSEQQQMYSMTMVTSTYGSSREW